MNRLPVAGLIALSESTSVEDFIEVAACYGLAISAADLSTHSDAMDPKPTIGDAQLESAAGMGYYACPDNSNFTAQRASACLTCDTSKPGCR
ncbi:MAG: hypothetical protein KA271_03595 [Propionivibrio sp.]|nr:hypothetical protein [Propionivibrio sp.]